MRSSSEKVRLCRFYRIVRLEHCGLKLIHTLRASARKCAPTGSIVRWVAAESLPRGLKLFSADQSAGTLGSLYDSILLPILIQ